MTLNHTPGSIKRFRRAAGTFQQTFHYPPIRAMRPFAERVVHSIDGLRGGSITIEAVVFEARRLTELLRRHDLPDQFQQDVTISASGVDETTDLFEAALGDCDLLFTPDPKCFACYADHDGYITFFAHTKGNLNRVVEPLVRGAFTPVEYHRGW